MLTDKEVFEFLSCLQMYGHMEKIQCSNDNAIWVNFRYASTCLLTFNKKIKWTHPSKQYPPPEEELEACRYCKSPVKHYGNTVDHPVVDNCILSGKCFKYKLWPKINPIPKDSLPVENDTPSLKSLGIDPVEVWRDAPEWAACIIIGEWWGNLSIAFCSKSGAGIQGIKHDITLPSGIDWRKCIWKRPEEINYCKYCLDEKTVPADGGNGWVPCPECGDNDGQ